MAYYFRNKEVSGNVEEIISLEEFKQHLKLDVEDLEEDKILKVYLGAGVKAAENYTETKILKCEFLIKMDSFPEKYAFFHHPVNRVFDVKYTSVDGLEHQIPVDNYDLLTEELESSIVTDLEELLVSKVEMKIECGYSEENPIPEDLKAAILLISSFFYENREDRPDKMPMASQRLLRSYKRYV